MFKEDLEAYRAKGAESLRKKKDELIQEASAVKASKAFMHFVADICMDLKDFRSALKILLQIEARYELDDVGYNNVAFCYGGLEQPKQEYAAYQKSLEINPVNISSLRGACYLGIEIDNELRAVQFCERFLAQSTDNPEAAIWYAIALLDCKRFEDLRNFVKLWESKFGTNIKLQSIISGQASETPTP